MIVYRSMASDCHLPRRQMMPSYTWAQMSDMAPHTHRERAETSVSTRPTSGPMRQTAWRRTSGMLFGVTGHREFTSLNVTIGVVDATLYCRQCMTRRPNAVTGQQYVAPRHACFTTSPRTPFFCAEKTREAEVLARSWASGACITFTAWLPIQI
jgi:hypothetical protein